MALVLFCRLSRLESTWIVAINAPLRASGAIVLYYLGNMVLWGNLCWCNGYWSLSISIHCIMLFIFVYYVCGSIKKKIQITLNYHYETERSELQQYSDRRSGTSLIPVQYQPMELLGQLDCRLSCLHLARLLLQMGDRKKPLAPPEFGNTIIVGNISRFLHSVPPGNRSGPPAGSLREEQMHSRRGSKRSPGTPQSVKRWGATRGGAGSST